jgi:hypothetical protein
LASGATEHIALDDVESVDGPRLIFTRAARAVVSCRAARGVSMLCSPGRSGTEESIQRLEELSDLFLETQALASQILAIDSAEKPLGMLRQAQHERKILNVINPDPVRPEALEG